MAFPRQRESAEVELQMGRAPLPHDAAAPSTFEKHYRIGELARLWGLGRETIRKLVKDDPGVLKIRIGGKKLNTTYSIPESAAQRIHTRLLNSIG
jgi:hypothetical protein